MTTDRKQVFVRELDQEKKKTPLIPESSSYIWDVDPYGMWGPVFEAQQGIPSHRHLYWIFNTTLIQPRFKPDHPQTL